MRYHSDFGDISADIHADPESSRVFSVSRPSDTVDYSFSPRSAFAPEVLAKANPA